jgi:trehalose 6-phosphate phosphatase
VTPPLPPRPALFLDVDGTLVPISTRPEDTRPDRALIRQLDRLHSALGGAVAILSGRTLATLSQLLSPLALPAAGVHGLERRRSDGSIVLTGANEVALKDARTALVQLARAEPELQIEDKNVAFAIHYRAIPHRESQVASALEEIARQLGPAYHVQAGLFVLELKPRRVNKGTALAEFMTEKEFRGRQPVAIGDDLTDLHAFRVAEELGGMGIAVGDRICAQWHFPHPYALRAWLDDLVARVSRTPCD